MALSIQLSRIENPKSRVDAFNAIVPWVKKIKKDYSIVDMYEVVFGFHSEGVRWNQATLRAMVEPVRNIVVPTEMLEEGSS